MAKGDTSIRPSLHLWDARGSAPVGRPSRSLSNIDLCSHGSPPFVSESDRLWLESPPTPTAGDGAITRPAFGSGSEPGTPELFQGQSGRQ